MKKTWVRLNRTEWVGECQQWRFLLKLHYCSCGFVMAYLSPTPTQPLVHSPTSRTEEKIRKVIVRKLGWDKDSLIGKLVQSRTRNLFTSSQRQAGIQPSSGKEITIRQNGHLGRQKTKLQTCAPSFFFPQISMLIKCCMMWNIPVTIWSQLSWLCPIPTSCAPLGVLSGGVGWEAEKALMLCKPTQQ